jgi:L-fuconolactonase
MMRQAVTVDAHTHVWDLFVRDQPWTRELPSLRRSFSVHDLAQPLRENFVNVTVLVQTLNIQDETPELLRVASESPIVSGVVGWIDLLDDVDAQIAELRTSAGGEFLVGVRHVVPAEDDPNWLRRPDVLKGLAAVANLGLSFDVVNRHDQNESIIQVARLLSNLNLVLDHLGGPLIAQREFDEWRNHIVELSQFENVAVKLSGLVTVADHTSWTVDDLRPYTDVVLSHFGSRRIMFGSDWPVCHLAATYGEVMDAAQQLTRGLSQDDREWVFGHSARVWYGLKIA